jgi:CRP-like cAMP-binding protein
LLFRVLFWVADYSTEERARDEVRTVIYYEFSRRKIEIPWPIQIEYQRSDPPPPDPGLLQERLLRAIGGVHVLAGLPPDARRALAMTATERMFGRGDFIVREGGTGSSMFIVLRGRVVVSVGPQHRQVAVIDAGGYFGEMSLLTGESRSATVTVQDGDCVVLEISADAFKHYVTSHPEVIDLLADAAAERRRELDQFRGATTTAAETRMSLADRMRQFFGLGYPV